MKKLAPYALALSLLAPLPAFADPGVGVLFLDDAGRWRADQGGRAKLPPGGFVGWEGLLRPEAVKKLSYQQRLDLLSSPERLLASDRAREIFTVDRVLVLHPAREGRVEAEVVDLVADTVRPMASTKDAEEGRLELLAVAGGTTAEAKLAVTGNPESHLYHLVDAPHLSPRAEVVAFDDVPTAAAQGYEACTICFPETNRVLAADQLDVALGKYVAAKIELEYRISPDPKGNERLARVGRRIMEANRFQDQGYKFILLDSDEINAFAAPTGPLYVTSGLLKVVESDDELAGILGHELAHSERKHARRQYEQSQRMGLLALLAAVATGQGWIAAAGDIAGTVLSRGYSRGFELEADRDAILLSYGAGYHPEDFLLTLTKFEELEKVRPRTGPSWLSTHPENEERQAQIRDLLAQIEPLQGMVAEIAPVDPGLAAWVRASAEEYLADPQDYQRFLESYRMLSLAPVQPLAPEAPSASETPPATQEAPAPEVTP